MGKLWRYSAGRAGRNLVTVYERYEGGPIWIQTWPGGRRKRESLRTLDGVRIYDKTLAERIADRVAAKLDSDQHESQLRLLLGIPERHTLAELLEEYHKRRGKGWADSNKAHQERLRVFWLDRLGRSTDVRRIRAVDVEEIASERADELEWSPRTEGKYLQYMVTAFNFGQKKLKWYTEEHNLSAVDIPSPDPKAAAYTTAEVQAIQRKLEDVDLRAAVAAHLAYVSLRRITAIRKLRADSWRTEDVIVDSEHAHIGVIVFPREWDKARKAGEVAVAGRALELVERLLETPAVKASGLLFPSGDLDDAMPIREPVRYEMLHDWWLAGEEKASVPHIHGRGWHGVKRRATTDAEAVMGGLVEAAKQAGTLEQTLRTIYVQPDLAPKAQLAVRLAARVA